MKNKIDVSLLRRQAKVVGTVMEDMDSGDPERRREKAALEGVWSLLHAVLDDLESKGKSVLEAKR